MTRHAVQVAYFAFTALAACNASKDGDDGVGTVDTYEPGNPTDSTSGSDSDTSASGDTATGDSATDTARDSGLATEVACHPFFPLDVPGRTWTYAYDDRIFAGTHTVQSMGATTFEGTAGFLVVTDVDISGIGARLTLRTDAWYTCQTDGVHVLARNSYAEKRVAGQLRDTWFVEDRYPGEPLLYPLDWQLGAEWVVPVETRTVGPDGEEMSSRDVSMRLVREESVEVPAGTFDTWVVEVVGSAVVPFEEHHVDGVGVVKGLSLELSATSF